MHEWFDSDGSSYCTVDNLTNWRAIFNANGNPKHRKQFQVGKSIDFRLNVVLASLEAVIGIFFFSHLISSHHIAVVLIILTLIEYRSTAVFMLSELNDLFELQ